MNRVAVGGVLLSRGELRYTPAGVEALDLVVRHESRQPVFGGEQSVELELQAVAFGALARQLQQVAAGSKVALRGFLMPTRRGARTLKLNITEWIEES